MKESKETEMKFLKSIDDKLDRIMIALKGNELILPEKAEEGKPPKQNSLNVYQCCKDNGLPTDIDFINEIVLIITKNRLTKGDAEEVFRRITDYKKDNKILDLKKLTFKFFYNYIKEKRIKGKEKNK